MNKLHKLTLSAATVLLCFPATVMAADGDKSSGPMGEDQRYGDRAQLSQQDQNRERSQIGQNQQLQVGFDRGTVMEIQRALSSEGHDLEVDGVWGPNTQQALRSYQESEELEGSGWPNNKTLAQLGINEESAWRSRFNFEGQEQQRGLQDSQQQQRGQEHSQVGQQGQRSQLEQHSRQERSGTN